MLWLCFLVRKELEVEFKDIGWDGYQERFLLSFVGEKSQGNGLNCFEGEEREEFGKLERGKDF